MAGFSESSGSSQGSSQSTSTPVSVTSPQTDWGLMQSQLLMMLADEQYKWAMDQYAKGEGVTDQTIANFMEMSGKGKGLADILLNQYRDQVKPWMDQWGREAASYASKERQDFMAGKAMSTVAQAMNAGREAAQRKLEGFGADPNAGEYKDMLLTSRIQDAAARAGAGTAAAERTAEIGRQMLAQGISWGQNIPGMAINAVQSAYAGLTGAENAILGLLNTAPNLASIAGETRKTAVAANKIPPVGQQSQASSQQSSQNQSKSQQKDKEGGEKQQKEPQGRQPGQGGGPGGGGMDDSGDMSQRVPYDYEQDQAAVGDPQTMQGYMGPVGYLNPDGSIRDEWSPTTGYQSWDNALQNPVSNWSLPESPGTGYNSLPFSRVPFEPTGNFPPIQSDPYTGDAQGNYGQTGPYTGDFQGNYGYNGNAAQENMDDWLNTLPNGPRSDIDGDFQNASYDPYGDNDFANYNNDQYDPYDFTGTDNDVTDAYNPYGDNDFNDYNNQNDYDYMNDDYSSPDYDFTGNDSDVTDAADYDYDSSYDDYSYDNAVDYDYGVDDYSYDDAIDYDYNMDDYSYDDYGGGYDDYGYDDYGYDDYGGGYDDYGYDDYGGDYAMGGRVRRPARPRGRPRPGVMPTSGGAVPMSASPSRGRKTDDISARLNAGEYVIPKDVVSHKGTEFFNNLIKKSRKLRTGMAGPKPGPTMRPALPARQRPTFQSRPMQ